MSIPLPFNPSGIRLDPARPLGVQLFQALRERILDGRLAARSRLPASRDLASSLGVSRNTVVRAYEQLYAEGYIEGRTGDGTYVAERVQPSVDITRSEARSLDAPALERLARHHLPLPPTGAPRAFRVGVPAFDLFPFDTWARLQARFWRDPPLDCLGYGAPAGEQRLRELVAAYLRTTRGLHCDAGQIIITSGAQQGITL